MERNVQRELLEYNIGGYRFIVDVSLSEMRLKDDPLKTISFFEMKDKGDHYELRFDEHAKAVATKMSRPEHVFIVGIQPMVTLDPEGVARKYGMDVETLPAKDRDLKTSAELVQKRLSGILPEIKIGEERYVVDVRLMELRSVATPDKSINLDQLAMSNDGEKYLSLYHGASGKLLPMVAEVSAPPGTVQLLVLPNEAWLDPIGTARKYGRDERLLLDRYPIQPKMEASLHPLENTNLQLKVGEKKEIAKEQKPAPKPQRRKGKRL